MIQRIQTVYLLLGAIALLSLLFFDLAWTSPAAESYPWFTPVVLVITGLIAVGTIVTVFLYGNRPRQKRTVEMLQYATLAFMLLLYGVMYMAGDLHFMREGETNAGKIMAMAAPVLGYIFLFLARRGISHDIALVRSMDRLR